MASFAFPLTGPLGLDITSTGPVITAPVGDVAVVLSNLIEQYKQALNLQAIVTAFAEQTQALQEAKLGLSRMNSITDSSGVQLDNIGKIIGEPRQGFDDVTYRLHLQARIILNRSSGTIEEILNLFEVLLGSAPLLTLREDFPAGINLTISGIALDPTLVGYLVGFLKAAKAAGVKTVLEWTEHPDTETFAFAGATGKGFDDGYFASAR